jgi:hypothetical protein
VRLLVRGIIHWVKSIRKEEASDNGFTFLQTSRARVIP